MEAANPVRELLNEFSKDIGSVEFTVAVESRSCYQKQWQLARTKTQTRGIS